MNKYKKINHIELASHNIKKTKELFTSAFNGGFIDNGPEWTALSHKGIDSTSFDNTHTKIVGAGV